MAKRDLAGVHKVTSRGRTYYYAWRDAGAPRLKGQPGTPEFVRSLREAHERRTAPDRTRMSGLCAMFRASDAWQGRGPKPLSESTKRSWRLWLDRIQEAFGELRIEQFDRPQMRPRIVKWRDGYAKTPRAADMGVQVLSRLLAHGQAEGLLLHNICSGIPGIYANDRSSLIWTGADLSALKAAASAELFLAAKLASLTGLRQRDLLALRWSDIGEHSLEITPAKTRRHGRRGRKVVVPMHKALKDCLSGAPRLAETVLVTTAGKPWGSGFRASWRRACARAGIRELHFHDLRGTAATRFYAAGFTVREIAEVMGWTEDAVGDLINRYVKRDEILRDRPRRLDEHASRMHADSDA